MYANNSNRTKPKRMRIYQNKQKENYLYDDDAWEEITIITTNLQYDLINRYSRKALKYKNERSKKNTNQLFFTMSMMQ